MRSTLSTNRASLISTCIVWRPSKFARISVFITTLTTCYWLLFVSKRGFSDMLCRRLLLLLLFLRTTIECCMSSCWSIIVLFIFFFYWFFRSIKHHWISHWSIFPWSLSLVLAFWPTPISLMSTWVSAPSFAVSQRVLKWFMIVRVSSIVTLEGYVV